jgi:hypothetical protein
MDQGGDAENHARNRAIESFAHGCRPVEIAAAKAAAGKQLRSDLSIRSETEPKARKTRYSPPSQIAKLLKMIVNSTEK